MTSIIVHTIALPLSPDFWNRVCQHLLLKYATYDLAHVQFVVPSYMHSQALLNAFEDYAHSQNMSLIPPQIFLFDSWLSYQHLLIPIDPKIADIAPLSSPPLTLSSEILVQCDIYLALRSNDWIQNVFGDAPSHLWALAFTLTQLGNQLCYAAYQHPKDFLHSFIQTIRQHYQNQGHSSIALEARLVLDIWQTLADSWPARQQLNQLQALLDYSALQSKQSVPSLCSALWWLCPHSLAPWESAFLENLDQTFDVTVVQVDYALSLADQPMYAAAWPEPISGAPAISLPVRARAVMDCAAPSLGIRAAHSLEQEAQFVARQVLEWLNAGADNIALVALDRLTIRRIRALLERADIVIRDETGWRLSTTSACAVVMRWFDVVSNQGYFRDVQDWLRSPFVFPGQPKQDALRLFQSGLAHAGITRGWDELHSLFDTVVIDDADQPALFQLRDWLKTLETHAHHFEKNSATFADYFNALTQLFDACGLQSSLEQDPVGRSVLSELRQIEQQLHMQTAPVKLTEFRAFLAQHFEQAHTLQAHSTEIESPIVVVSLNGAHLRQFDYVVVVGAGAELLPSTPTEILFLNESLRTQLGLPTAAQARVEQFHCWLSLLCGAKEIIVTWRNDNPAQPKLLSPWLAQYRSLVKLALQQDVLQPIVLPTRLVAQQLIHQPAPQVKGFWPEKISASRYQSFVDCPYRYFANSILCLSEEEEVNETLEQRELGRTIHQILESFHRILAQQSDNFDTSDAQTKLLTQLVTSLFAPLVARAPDYLAAQIEFVSLIPDYLKWWHSQQAAGWQWQTAEHFLQKTLTVDEHHLLLHGRLDRIDLNSQSAAPLAKLIDYKITSAAKLKKRLSQPGEDVQLPFYTLLYTASPSCASYLSMRRNEITEIIPDYDLTQASQTLATHLMQNFVRIHAGAAMPAQGDDETCKYCEMRGVCRRDEWKTEAKSIK